MEGPPQEEEELDDEMWIVPISTSTGSHNIYIYIL